MNKDTQNNSPFVKANFEERKQKRKDYFQQLSDKLTNDSITECERASKLSSIIPAGQPIHVGHYGEKRDRNYRNKIDRTMKRSCELEEKAKYYQEKANYVDTSISSVDPEALNKLRDQVAEKQAKQEMMKNVNKALRSKNVDQALAKLGLDEKQIQKAKTPDFAGRIGYPRFELTNNNSSINRLKKRIASIEKLRQQEPLSFESEDFNVKVEDGQIKVIFHHGKPSDEALHITKKLSGFKWSSYQKAWVRKYTGNALYSAKHLIKYLEKLDSIY